MPNAADVSPDRIPETSHRPAPAWARGAEEGARGNCSRRILGRILSSRFRCIALLAGAWSSACTIDNPTFELKPEGGSGSSTIGSGSGEASVGSPESGDALETSAGTTVDFDTTTGTTVGFDGTTGGFDGTTGDTPTTSSSSSGTASTGFDERTSTGGELSEVAVPAVVATCVLLEFASEPYLGPQECEQKSVAADGVDAPGVMVLDTAFIEQGGNSRPARVFLRFDVPADLAGKDLTAATVAVHAASGPTAGGPHAGELWATESFDPDSLKDFAPGNLEVLTGDPGLVVPSTWINWDLPVERLEPGKSLYLGLVATDNDGVLYRTGLAEPGLTPVLTIAYF